MKKEKYIFWLVLMFLFAQPYFFDLPVKMATHFDFNGNPNGWMSKEGYLIFNFIFTGFIGCVLYGVGFFTSKYSDSLINIPNKSYWLSEKRKTHTILHIEFQIKRIGVLVLGFLGITNYFVLKANQLNSPHLSENFIYLVLVFLILMSSVAFQIYKKYSSIPIQK